jgi:hypothetical protein
MYSLSDLHVPCHTPDPLAEGEEPTVASAMLFTLRLWEFSLSRIFNHVLHNLSLDEWLLHMQTSFLVSGRSY